MSRLHFGLVAFFVSCALGCSSEADLNSADAGARTDDAGDSNLVDGGPNAPDSTPNTADANVATGCSAEALELINLVNEYRGENSLAPIPASTSLCFVSDTHVRDLVENSPDAPGQCNLHSWSDQGSWSACCYTDDHAAAQCMWDKPRELTVYTGNGYENAAGSGGTISPAQALQLWKNSTGHREVILNQGIWNQEWRALGAGIHNGYAVLWFGHAVDPAD